MLAWPALSGSLILRPDYRASSKPEFEQYLLYNSGFRCPCGTTVGFFERFARSLLFEIGAVPISAMAVLFAGQSATDTDFGMGVTVSFTAMARNFVFNWGFNKVFTSRREQRGWGVRMLQAGILEGGLLLFTTPPIAWFLKISSGRHCLPTSA